MKIWKGYGSEHSMNLVMIGHFKEARDAEEVKKLLDQLTSQVMQDTDGGQIDKLPQDRFSETILEFLMKANLYILRPAELEQLLYDIHIDVDGDKIVVTTDEADISAFLKVLLEKGARIEVYSARHFPNTEYGR